MNQTNPVYFNSHYINFRILFVIHKFNYKLYCLKNILYISLDPKRAPKNHVESIIKTIINRSISKNSNLTNKIR